MPGKRLSTKLSKMTDKSLSKWEEAIADAQQRIKEFKRSIKTFESLRDQGMAFPEPPSSKRASKIRLTD